MRIVHVSDPHVVSSPKECKRIYGLEIDPRTSLLEMSRYIAYMKPDMVVVTGDISCNGKLLNETNGRRWYETFHLWFVRPLIRKGIKVHVLPGNHDQGREFGFNLYRLYFGGERYVVNNWSRKLVFFTPRFKSRKAHPTDEDLEWLEKNLEEGCLLFTHSPVQTWKRKGEVLEMMDGTVSAVFCGHYHRNLVFHEPVETFVVSSMSASWWNFWGDSSSAILIIQEKNTLSTKFVQLEMENTCIKSETKGTASLFPMKTI